MSSGRFETFKDAQLQIIDGDRGLHYPKKTEFENIGYCVFLNTGNVTKTGFNFSSVDFITQEKDNLLKKGKIQRNDIVLTTRGTVGNVAFYNNKVPYDNIRINSGMVILRAEKDYIEPEYLYYFLKSKLFFKQVSNNDSGSAQPQLPISSLNFIKIPYVTLIKQKSIAKVLSDLDAKIELNNRINTELEAMAKTLYDYWFVQFDYPFVFAQGKPSTNGKPYKSSGGKMVWNEKLKREIPEGWEVGTLDNIGKIIGGSTPSKAIDENFCINTGTPWITPKDLSINKGNKYITRGEYDVTDLGIKEASLKVMPKGTVLLSSRAPIGYLAISREKVTTNQGFKSFVPKSYFSTEFIYFTIQNSIKTIEANSSGSTFKEISSSVLKTIKTYLPTNDVIKEYNDRVIPVFKRQDILEQENQQLTALRDWLLPMLMNGQVSVE